MAKQVKISIIIATKNEATNLPRLLTSLKKQSFQDFEIIIVDNHSTDETLTIARKFTSLVFNYGNERSSQRNFGAQKAKGAYLLFLDADMELPRQILAECLGKITPTSVVALIIPETVQGKSFFASIKRLEKNLYQNEPMIEAPRFFKKKAFLKSGGYDKNLIAGEDWDLAQEIKQVGKIGRIPSMLFHYENSLFRELKHKAYYGRFVKRYAKIHPNFFSKQSGSYRIKLLFRKRKLLLKDPLAAIGLFLLKFFEYAMYRIILLYNDPAHEN